ncbi:MAG TPA: nickel pincer cofactor biosynthesis protein LarB [Spirochaetota bacterium]|nr:nickel pincer cofactor biosynthesis protein LarB [Spirochaetota bacterium]
MNSEKLRMLLENVKTGSLSVDDAVNSLSTLPYEDLVFAKVDTHRELRRGAPEVIYSKGKTAQQVFEIARVMSGNGQMVLATKASHSLYLELAGKFKNIAWHEQACIISIGTFPEPSPERRVLVITAGTTDIPVAEEAAVTASSMGCAVEKLYDAGIAGIHRLLDKTELLRSASVIIAVAGMDGALPAVAAGLVKSPVIAVPSSTGYGAGFGGIAPLLTMLNSCSPGVAVVNIDNGFGAGYLAAVITGRGA